ncbi:MAG TPA: PAS domain S-box protein [Salinimicrobium sp.]|nr:PAS domain S-box protein [Salinimicrobium sp.]
MRSVIPSFISNHKFQKNNLKNYTVDLRNVFEQSPIAFYTCDRDGFVTYFNNAAVKLWGRVPELGNDLWCGSWKVYYPSGKPMSFDQNPMALTLKEGYPHEDIEVTIERPDKSFRNLLVFARPIFDDQENLIGAHNTLVDITRRQEDEIKQATLSAIVESSDDAIISRTLDGIITSWNRAAERIFKFSAEEIIGESIKKIIPESRLHDEEIILSKVKKGIKVDHFETVRMDKNGKQIPLSLTISPVKDSSGKVIGASKVARDISDRVKGDEKQSVLSAIVESSDDAIISKDLNGIIMSWNGGAERIFGYTEDEAVGRSITMLIPEERMEEENLIIGNIKQGKRIDHFETIRQHKNGSEINISLTVSPIKNRKGEIIGASKIARDVTAQVRAQEEIKLYNRNLKILNALGKNLSENLDVKVILQAVTDASTKITGAAFGAFFYTRTDENGESLQLFTISGAPKEAFEKFGMPRNTAVFGPTFAGEKPVRIANITKDHRYGHNKPHQGMPEGHPPVVSYMAIPVISKNGKTIGGLFFGHPEEGVFTASHEEIVSNIAVQAAVSLDNSALFDQVKSLSAKKDEFIALASHELKTPLTTIKGYLQVLNKQTKDTMSELFIQKSLNQVNKLNTLVNDLLHMSRMESGKLEFNREEFDLREMLQDITETYGYSHKSHKIISDFGESPAIIEADKQRIEQAMNNIITNAIKYSPKADEIYVKLEIRRDMATVVVKDKGIGLSEKQRKMLFTRFYRAENTKGISGLGLGLYLTKQIIDRHNGYISVKSKLGEGSEFSVNLPLKK